MKTIKRSIEIDAPPPVVFRALDDQRLVPLFSRVVRTTEIIEHSGKHVGNKVRTSFKIGGISFKADFVTTKHERSKQIEVRASGDFNGTMNFRLERVAPKTTRLTCTAKYRTENSASVTGKVGTALLHEAVNFGVMSVLSAVKSAAETGVVAGRHAL